jgi:hypothetical protein
MVSVHFRIWRSHYDIELLKLSPPDFLRILAQAVYLVRQPALHRAAFFENSIHETNLIFGPFRSFQLPAESGSCVALSGHLAAMMA